MVDKKINTMVGVDEVGRGALCGPVSLGFFRSLDELPRLTFSYPNSNWASGHFQDLKFVKDSKKLKSQEREHVLEVLKNYRHQGLVLSAGNTLIDEYGIGVCLSYLVMMGLLILPLKDDEIIIDGQIKILKDFDNCLVKALCSENQIELDQINLLKFESLKPNIVRENKADDKYLVVALASNIAKVSRDKLMIIASNSYPKFNWAQNKGYGTVANREAIVQDPANPLIRKSFCRKLKPFT